MWPFFNPRLPNAVFGLNLIQKLNQEDKLWFLQIPLSMYCFDDVWFQRMLFFVVIVTLLQLRVNEYAKNVMFNFYLDDHSRVKLQTENEATDVDYINANFIPVSLHWRWIPTVFLQIKQLFPCDILPYHRHGYGLFNIIHKTNRIVHVMANDAMLTPGASH